MGSRSNSIPVFICYLVSGVIMPRILSNASSYNMTITPRDSGNLPITGLGEIAAPRWTVSDGTSSHTVNSCTSVSSGGYDRYILNISPVNTPLGVKNMTITLDSVPVATAPTPLQYNFRPPDIFEDPEISWAFMLNGKMSVLHHRKSTTTAYLEVLNLRGAQMHYHDVNATTTVTIVSPV